MSKLNTNIKVKMQAKGNNPISPLCKHTGTVNTGTTDTNAGTKSKQEQSETMYKKLFIIFFRTADSANDILHFFFP